MYCMWSWITGKNTFNVQIKFIKVYMPKKRQRILKKSAWENWPKDVINNKTGCKEGWHIVSRKDGSSVLTISISAKISALFTVTLTTSTRHLSLPWCLCMFLCGCVRCVWKSVWNSACVSPIIPTLTRQRLRWTLNVPCLIMKTVPALSHPLSPLQ